jgi:hypothetical protein
MPQGQARSCGHPLTYVTFDDVLEIATQKQVAIG